MFIDAHLHTAIRKGLPSNAEGYTFASPEELIEIMDRTGVDKGILLPLVSPECRHQLSPPDDILEICAKYPDRFYPFCNIDPREGRNSSQTDFTRHLNYYKERGCLGVGEITANLGFTDPLVFNLFRHCEQAEMPVLFHIAPQQFNCYGLIDALGLPGLTAALETFPKLMFIGHSQPFWAEISGDADNNNRRSYPTGPVTPGGALPKLMERFSNLYCGWDAGSGFNGLTRDPEFGWSFMEKFKDRILFGTDICDVGNDMQHAAYLRQSLQDKRISREAFENISWRNANRLLKLGL